MKLSTKHASFCFLSVCLSALSSVATEQSSDKQGSGAITFGEPDGNRHPYVVSVVFRRGPEAPWTTWCTGSLISPTVVLTAGHCTATLEGDRRFTFPDGFTYEPWSVAEDCSHCPDSTDRCPNFAIAFGPVVDENARIIGATPHSFPGWQGSLLSSVNDVAVMILKQPVLDVEPACLIEEGFLDAYDAEGHSFMNVGYVGPRPFLAPVNPTPPQ